MSRPLGDETVTIRRGAYADDGHGNQVFDWSAPTLNPVEGCDVQPGVSQEYYTGGDPTLIAYTVFMPGIPDVVSTDRADWNGQTYTIYGDPGKFKSRGGRLDHTVLYLRTWKG